MPFTFFAHQLPVLPIAYRFKRKVDGLALVAGSMAPDLAYALWFTPFSFNSHTIFAQLWWSTPVGTLLAILTRRYIIAPTVACLPDIPPIHLRDYQLIATRTKPFLLTCGCALLGSSTHIVLDSFTHSNGYVVQNWHFLQRTQTIFNHPLAHFQLLQYGGHLIGSIGCLLLLCFYGKKHWINYAPTEIPLQQFIKSTFISYALVGCGVSLLILVFSWHHSPIAASMRGLWALYIGLFLASSWRSKSESASESLPSPLRRTQNPQTNEYTHVR